MRLSKSVMHGRGSRGNVTSTYIYINILHTQHFAICGDNTFVLSGTEGLQQQTKKPVKVQGYPQIRMHTKSFIL